jgi:hypothetical protein
MSQPLGATQRRNPVSDPYTEELFSCLGKPDGQLFNNPRERSGYGAFRILADLNFDGSGDMILTKGQAEDGITCGTSGCPVVIYLKQPNGLFLGLDHWLHPLAVGLLKAREGEGTLTNYGRTSGKEGAIGYYRVSTDSVVQTRIVPFDADIEADQKLYASLFSSKTTLQPEFGSCQNETISWSRR